jgi:hypothetical protein
LILFGVVMRNVKLIASALAIASLVACGGGGGGTAAAPETFPVTGTAAKGILKNADVQAYELVAGSLVKYGTATTTDASGAFSLSLTKTENPVIVSITTNASTKMLDETSIVNGKFEEVAAPKDLVLRTMVPDLTAAADAQANPFTEMAIAGALAATDASGAPVTLTKDVLLVSKEAVKTQLGINPFALKAVDADNTTATADQKKLMTLLTGVAKSAKDDPTCTATCQVTNLGKTAAIKYDKSTGKGNFKDATAMAASSNALSTKAATVTGNPLLVTLPTFAAVKDSDLASATEVAARDSFETFIKVMRDGATTVGNALDASKKTIDERTQGLTFNTAKAGVDAFNAASARCRFPDTKLVCEGEGVVGSDGTYELTYKSGDFTNKIKATGTVENTVGTLSITGTSNAITKQAADLSMSIVLTGLTGQNANPDSITLSLSLTGYDDESAKPVTVSFEKLAVKLNSSGTVASISGGLSIENALKDKLSGTISLTSVDLGPDADSLQSYQKDGSLNVKGYVDGKTLIALGLSGSNDYTKYKPWEVESEANAQIATANVSIGLVDDGVKLDITGNKTGYNKRDLKVVFKSGANSITATADKGSNDVNLTSSSGNFTAKLTKGTDGVTTGKIYQGSVQVGTIEDGMIKVNGQELSLK